MNKKAFSLVEISVVLLIIALLISAVSVGKRIIATSKRHKFITGLNEIITAVQTFELTYKALPGDFDEASSFFSSCSDHGSMSQLTCNGDGNKQIGSIYSSEGGLAEHSYVYLHMKQADIYQGGFAPSTIGTSNGYYSVEDLNTPSFELADSVGYYAFWGNDVFGDRQYEMINGAISSTSDNKGRPYAGAMSPKTLYLIDRKLDDGAISTGKVQKRNAEGLTCSDLKSDAVTCGLRYLERAY